MRIQILVKPNSKLEKVEKIDDSNFKVYVKEPPIENKANEAVIRLISEYFRVQRSKITIIKGAKSKIKIVEIQMQ